MKEKARINTVSEEVKHIELLFSKKKWEDVLCQAGDVIAQLQKLAKQSGQSSVEKSDVCKMIEKVK